MNPLINVEALRELIREVLAKERAAVTAGSELMTTAEAADFARLKPATIREWVRTERLRAQYIGRRLRITRAALEAAMTVGRGKRSTESVEARARRAARAVLGRG